MTNRERAESLLLMVEPEFGEMTAHHFEKVGREFLAAARRHFDEAVAAEREANDKILTDMQSESAAYKRGVLDGVRAFDQAIRIRCVAMQTTADAVDVLAEAVKLLPEEIRPPLSDLWAFPRSFSPLDDHGPVQDQDAS